MSSSPAIRVQNLNVRFGDFFAVKNISFSVEKGEVFGFLGANGAGKTTTIRVLCGLLAPTSGEIEVVGKKFAQAGPILKIKVGYMSQKFTLYDDLTINENLSFTADLHRISQQKRIDKQKELLEFIQWDRPLNTMVKDLPGGQKQQIALIASLMHDPEIIFLDEPTAGVSPKARSKFWELIRQLGDRGKTIFVTTHHMDEAEQCGRIALMQSGELVALDSPQNLKTQTFPQGLFEFEPKHNLIINKINKLKEEIEFSLFEPYGSRFHVELKRELTQKEQTMIEQFFYIQPIAPSLEDVFIRIVEGTNR